MINIKSLYKSYGIKEVLKDINLTFKKGEINGIVGENGAGKTTLFRCIAGLENYNGHITYGHAILKNVAGFLPTNPYFISRMTGLEYIRLLCNARKINIPDFERINIFDLPLDQYADTYSTGMKKKLALTAILIQKNDIFIFDEPFNGVDIQSNMIFKEVLLKLKELNKIIILSSHIFSTLSENCDRLYLIKSGKIIKRAGRSDFKLIEQEMKSSEIGNRIDKLNLS